MPPPARPAHRLRQRALLFLAILGPGIVTANVDNDAGGIATYAACGARFGYALLWTLPLIALALVAVQEMANRIGVVTGQGLSGLIRERFGVRATFWLLLALLVVNFGNIVAEFVGIAAGGELLGVPRAVGVPMAAFVVWLLVLKGNYKVVERAFLGACLFYLAYVITPFLSDVEHRPDWNEIGRSMLDPQIDLGSAAIVMVLGLIGSTIAPWMQFFQTDAVAEKGIPIERYLYSRIDTIVGCVVVTVVAGFIVIVCGATLFPEGVRVETAEEAAASLGPIAGRWARSLFAFGLLNASLFAACVLPLSTAFTVCEGLGFESGVNKRIGEAPWFYGLYITLLALGGLCALVPGLPLVDVMVYSQVLNGVLLPVVLVYMVILARDRRILGDLRVGRLQTGVVLVTAAACGAASLGLLW